MTAAGGGGRTGFARRSAKSAGAPYSLAVVLRAKPPSLLPEHLASPLPNLPALAMAAHCIFLTASDRSRSFEFRAAPRASSAHAHNAARNVAKGTIMLRGLSRALVVCPALCRAISGHPNRALCGACSAVCRPPWPVRIPVSGNVGFAGATLSPVRTRLCSSSVRKLSSTERIKVVLRDYGTVAVVFHTAISLASLGTCYLVVDRSEVMPSLFLSHTHTHTCMLHFSLRTCTPRTHPPPPPPPPPHTHISVE